MVNACGFLFARTSLRLQCDFIFQKKIHTLTLDNKLFRLQSRAGPCLLNCRPPAATTRPVSPPWQPSQGVASGRCCVNVGFRNLGVVGGTQVPSQKGRLGILGHSYLQRDMLRSLCSFSLWLVSRILGKAK